MTWVDELPAFALAVDGTIYVNALLFDGVTTPQHALEVAEHLERKPFIGVALDDEDAALLRRRTGDAFSEAAAFIIGRHQRLARLR